MNCLWQVAEVLAYTVENQVHTFVEPVLELCAALLATYAPPPGAPLTPLGESARQGAHGLLQLSVGCSVAAL